ncbi:AMP-binding protein [Acrocarpospora catenulata]|uniref:AMP-binding protein n=1 Tax=Acrocarpospora catenulata TaxID=2836182 RepID=UPI001BDB2F2C|nr:AMP-binding protein [Acrocarpospora catenulata]
MPVRRLTPSLAASYRDAGLWQSRSLVRTVADLAAGSRRAVSDGLADLTYDALLARVGSMAAWLLARGARPGDVLALESRGRADILLAHLACDSLDMIVMPMSHMFTEPEVAHLLAVSRARYFVMADGTGRTPRDAAALRGTHPHIETLIGGDAGPSLAEIFATPGLAPAELPEPDPDRPHLAMISSGTTQLPKVSLWSDNNLWFLLSQFASRVALRPDDVVLQVAPPNTGSTGYVFPVLAPVLFGARSIMLSDWSADAALDLIERERVTVATAVPTQMIKMVAAQEARARDVTSLRAFNNAGAKLEEAHARRVESVLGCRVQTSYGASDGGVPVLTSIDDDDAHRHRSVGRLLPMTDCRLVGENGAEPPAGTPGQVVWRTPSKSYGYLNNPGQDERMFDAEGWYQSGDLGLFDEEGYLHIVGRTRDMIIRGGLNINPGEIEDLALRHPAVAEVAVVGVPDEVYGERAAACVVPVAGRPLVLEELCAFLLAQGMAKQKLPERLVLLDELPKNSGGKVSKRDLRLALTR